MTNETKSVDPQTVFCEVCLKLVPRSEAVMAEAKGYVAYFCGADYAPEQMRELESSTHEGAGSGAADSIARWAAKNRNIRRVWVYARRAKETGRPDGDIDIAVELEPVGDSEETLAVWIANAGLWRAQLQSRLSPTVDLEWFDPDGSTRTDQAGLDQAKVLIYERVD